MKPASLLLLASALAGCGGAVPARWIAQAAGAHAQADALAGEGRLPEAARLLEEFAASPAPAQVAEQDRRAVLQDTYARLAELALRQRDPERALRSANAGLSLGEGRDVFTSALRTFRGRAQEALGHDREAARDYEAAQVLAEALLADALAAGGAR
jgi:hypothetical protein